MKGVQHLEAVRLRVREQKELLTGANKELRRLKKTLKTFEVHAHTHGPSQSPDLLMRTPVILQLLTAWCWCI